MMQSNSLLFLAVVCLLLLEICTGYVSLSQTKRSFVAGSRLSAAEDATTATATATTEKTNDDDESQTVLSDTTASSSYDPAALKAYNEWRLQSAPIGTPARDFDEAEFIAFEKTYKKVEAEKKEEATAVAAAAAPSPLPDVETVSSNDPVTTSTYKYGPTFTVNTPSPTSKATSPVPDTDVKAKQPAATTKAAKNTFASGKVPVLDARMVPIILNGNNNVSESTKEIDISHQNSKSDGPAIILPKRSVSQNPATIPEGLDNDNSKGTKSGNIKNIINPTHMRNQCQGTTPRRPNVQQTNLLKIVIEGKEHTFIEPNLP